MAQVRPVPDSWTSRLQVTKIQAMTLALQRSSLREEWGVTLQYSIQVMSNGIPSSSGGETRDFISDPSRQDQKLLLGVKDIATDSPACRSLKVGDVITSINDWQVQTIKEPEVAANLLRAAGNFVTLNIDRFVWVEIHYNLVIMETIILREACGKNWRPLDSF